MMRSHLSVYEFPNVSKSDMYFMNTEVRIEAIGVRIEQVLRLQYDNINYLSYKDCFLKGFDSIL